MNTVNLNEEAQKAEQEKLQKIRLSLDNIVNKKSKFLFVVPESPNPVASIYEIYFHATVVKNMGYEVIMMVEKGDYAIPTWIEKELTNLKHIPMSDSKITVGPEDIMVIPEVYSNIMEQTKKLPCLRVGFLQSVDYMLNSLIPGTDWSSFGIRDIITTSQTLKEWINIFYGKEKFNINTYNVGIPEYFERSSTPQKPVISIIGRNANEVSKFVKLFYARNPQYNWITFDPMITKSKPPQPMRRVDFAKRLQENFAAIWIDRIASFGTFPLECMKSGVIPICLKPDIMPEYLANRDENGNIVGITEGSGVWTENYYDLPILASEVLIKFLDDNISSELYDSMNNIAAKYNQVDSETRLNEIYQGYIEQRIKLFQEALPEYIVANEPAEAGSLISTEPSQKINN